MTDPPLNQYACTRCRRLKKKCSKEYPKCANCRKQNEHCEYVERKNKRRRDSGGDSPRKLSPLHSPKSFSLVAVPLGQDDRVVWVERGNLGLRDTALPPIRDGVRDNVQDTAPKEALPTTSNLSALLNNPSSSSSSSPFTTNNSSIASSVSSITASSLQFLPANAKLSPVVVLPNPASLLSGVPVPKPVAVQSHAKSPCLVSLTSPAPLYTGIVRAIFADSINKVSQPADTEQVFSNALDAYFVSTHRLYPFLEEQQIKHNDITAVCAPAAESLVAASVGCLILEAAGAISGSQGYPAFFFGEASKIVNEVTLTGLESAEMLTLICQYFSYCTDSDRSWMAVGTLLRLVVALNLHRNTPDTTASQSRLFFAAYTLDRIVSGSLGRPVALSDDDIDTTLPERAPNESQADLDIFRRFVEMTRVEGLILQNVHNARASENFRTSQDKEAIKAALRREVEGWYSRCRGYRAQMAAKSITGLPGVGRMPLQNPTAWFNAEYYLQLAMLYEPSALTPALSAEDTDLLAKCAIQGLSFFYSVYTSNWFPCSWVVFHRILFVVRALLYCLRQNRVDLFQVRTSLPLAREMLDYFASVYPFCTDLASCLNKLSASLDESEQVAQQVAQFEQVLVNNDLQLAPETLAV